MALIIGSVAMNRALGYEYRKPKDIDYFGTQTAPHIDFFNLPAEPFWHESFEDTQLDRDDFATLDELYTIKVSHAYWNLKNNSWDKHIVDILTLRSAGAKIDQKLHDLLYLVWVEKHGSKKMNLAQSSGMFFQDAVKRIYDHDSIHRSTARREYALYEMFLKPGQDVDMDMKKVWAQPHNIIVELFREEVAATALERWLIPTDYKFSPGLAWKLALKKTITSLTRGKSAQLIVENFAEFMKPQDNIDSESYLARHLRQKDRLILL